MRVSDCVSYNICRSRNNLRNTNEHNSIGAIRQYLQWFEKSAPLNVSKGLTKLSTIKASSQPKRAAEMRRDTNRKATTMEDRTMNVALKTITPGDRSLDCNIMLIVALDGHLTVIWRSKGTKERIQDERLERYSDRAKVVTVHRFVTAHGLAQLAARIGRESGAVVEKTRLRIPC